MTNMSEFVVITGMSGAGRTQAADDLEDLGWFVIDNMPPALLPRIAELAITPGSAIQRVALVAGTGQYHAELLPAIQALRDTGVKVIVLYLEATTDVLVRRYTSSRRPHPLGTDGAGLTAAIEREREMLDEVKTQADLIIDTGDLNVHQLKSRIDELFATTEAASRMRIAVTSFGFKHGLPRDVDLVLDCRFLPNPHWDPELREFSGLDEPVRDFVLRNEVTTEFLNRVDPLLEMLVPAYVNEGKAYLTIALGCTGGRHRSVAIAEEIARRLRLAGHAPVVQHRDITK